tara:strand:+ start:238 stop:387 length:150 start_codon:yes stop_codon:yes gene_type:complete
MKKEKMYCAKKKGTFRMMFGFSKPYMHPSRKKSDGIIEVSVNLKNTVKL